MVFALLTAWGHHAFAAELIRIETWDARSDQSVIVSKAVLKRAYQELNQPIEFVELPVRRALTMLLDGTLDANVYRASALFSNYPQLVRVPTAINSVSIRGYVRKDSSLHIIQWSDTGSIVSAYLRGTRIIENKLPASSRRVAATTVDETFRMVARGMADIAIVVEPTDSPAHPLAASDNLTRLAPVIDQLPLYHALSSRHRDLAMRLNVVLEKMSASGEMREIQKSALLVRPK